MKIAIFLEDENLCRLDASVEEKLLKVCILDTKEECHNELKITYDYIYKQSINYISLCLISWRINRVITAGINENAQRLFIKMNISVEILSRDQYNRFFDSNLYEIFKQEEEYHV